MRSHLTSNLSRTVITVTQRWLRRHTSKQQVTSVLRSLGVTNTHTNSVLSLCYRIHKKGSKHNTKLKTLESYSSMTALITLLGFSFFIYILQATRAEVHFGLRTHINQESELYFGFFLKCQNIFRKISHRWFCIKIYSLAHKSKNVVSFKNALSLYKTRAQIIWTLVVPMLKHLVQHLACIFVLAKCGQFKYPTISPFGKFLAKTIWDYFNHFREIHRDVISTDQHEHTTYETEHHFFKAN